MVFFVVHKTENAYGARCYVKEPFHIFWLSKGKAGTADLAGDLSGFEFFPSRHHQKIKFGSLGVAEKKILADFDLQKPVDLLASFDCEDGFVVKPLIGDLEFVQEIIGADFLGKSGGGVLRPSGVDGLVNFGGNDWSCVWGGDWEKGFRVHKSLLMMNGYS